MVHYRERKIGVDRRHLALASDGVHKPSCCNSGSAPAALTSEALCDVQLSVFLDSPHIRHLDRMLHNPFSSAVPGVPPHNVHGTTGRPSLQLPGIPASISRHPSHVERFSDARTHGYQGKSRAVTLPNAASPGPAALSKNQAGDRCVVVGSGCTSCLFCYLIQTWTDLIEKQLGS